MHKTHIPDDGYTEKGYIAKRPGLHGPVRFTFRPASILEHGQVTSKEATELGAEEYNRNSAEFVVAKLQEWSLLNGEQKALAIDFENVWKLKPAVFNRMFGIIAGWDPSDIDPEWPPAERREASELAKQAKSSGAAFGTVKAEADAGNLPEG